MAGDHTFETSPGSSAVGPSEGARGDSVPTIDGPRTQVHQTGARRSLGAETGVAPDGPPQINRARLYVTRLDAWSVAKVAFMLSLALAVMILIAVASSWWALNITGVFEALARNLNDIIGSGTTTFDLRALLSFERVMGVTLVLAALEVFLVSLLSALLAMFYNVTVGVTGGVEVVLSDDA